MNNKIRNNSGMVMFVVLAIITLALIGILIFSAFWKNQVHFEEQITLQAIGKNLAKTAVSYTATFLQDKINDKNSSNFKKKFIKTIIDIPPGSSKDLSSLILSSSEFDVNGLKELIGEIQNPLKLETPFIFKKSFIKVSISALKKIDNGIIESKDRVGILEISAHIEYGSGREIYHTLKTRVKIVNVQVPVLSKFTLAVFDLPSGADSDYYNKTLVNIIGKVVKKKPYVSPLVLDNSTKARDLDSGGWIFLGANSMKKIILKMAAGVNNMGEMFHIFDPALGMPLPAFVLARSKPNEAPPTVFPKYAMYLAIVGNYWGFYDKMNSDHYDVFHNYFQGIQKKYAPCSSSLKLYGTRSHPSRTMVVGNVKQCIPYYSIIAKVNKTTGNGELPIVMLKNVNSSNFKNGFINCFPILNPSGNGKLIPGDRALNVYLYLNAPLNYPVPIKVNPSHMFNYTYGIYKYYMSNYNEYPYNWDYEFMEYNSSGFDPEQYVHPKTFKKTSYSVNYSTFRMMNPKNGKKYYEGNLMDFSGETGKLKKILENKKITEFEDEESFLANCLKGKNLLEIPGVIFIKKGPLKIEKDFRFKRGGIIVLRKGDILFDSSLSESSSGTSTFVTLGGNIKINGIATIVASLIACKSGINGTGGHIITNGEVKIKGNMVCEEYNPGNLKDGGILKYDNRLDPYLHDDVRLYLENRDMKFDGIN